jgi:imidazolonepropionase-like amidohydrolase
MKAIVNPMPRGRKFMRLTFLAVALAFCLPAAAQDAQAPRTLFTNVDVFDGLHEAQIENANVLVEGNVIAAVSTEPIDADGATVVDGAGRTLMPGLIDAHWHTMLVRPTVEQAIYGDFAFVTILAALEAEATLMRGFTTVRDMGGPAFGLKLAIDSGLVPGPRIYPSGAMITTTGGHGDFRFFTELPRTPDRLTRSEVMGGSMIADGPDEVRMRVREQLMLGASQIKLTAGGGVASPHSPLDVATFSEAELKAAVDAAESWDTYVAVHAYTSKAVERAIAAGVEVIEHAHLMDDEAARMLAEKDIWLSTQPFTETGLVGEALPPASLAKKEEVIEGTDNVYRLAKKHHLKVAFGTDILFSAQEATRQGAWVGRLTKWYTPAEALAMATGTNGELLQLTGKRNPYPGRLGVVEAGALADLLLVDGDPVADIDLVADPDRFLVIMKDGVIYKSTLE